MRSLLVFIALLVSTIPVWAERGQMYEGSQQWDSSKKQKPPLKKGPALLVEAWWKTVVDPAIFAFRDCAIVAVTIDPDATSPGYMAGNAVSRACTKESNHLQGVLVSGYSDDDKAKATFDKISQSFVLPALGDAIKRKRAAEAGQRSPQEERSLTALNRLFDCGADSSRRLSSATSDSAETIAKNVLNQCAPLLTDYTDLAATTSAQKRDLERDVVAKFRPFVIQQVVDMRAGVQAPVDNAGAELGSVANGQ